MPNPFKTRYALASALLLAIAAPPAAPAMARSPNPLQALKGALDTAAGQAKQPAAQQGRPAAGAAASRAPAGDCCSAEAMKRAAAGVSDIDVAGVKLGMTPEQAFAAVQAFNPKMTVQVNKGSYYTLPPDAPNRQLPIPWYAIAHTAGKAPSTFMAADSSTDQILIEFSTPPSPPMVVRVVRFVSFPDGQPLVSATLHDSLTKKYGPVTAHGPTLGWFFDPEGRHVASGPPFCGAAGEALYELPVGPPFSPGNLTEINTPPLQEFAASQADTSRDVNYLKQCRSFGAIVTATPGDDMGRDLKVVQMEVVLSSPPLIYAARKNAQDWLDAKFAAYRDKQDNAAKSRAAPKL